jgi:PII-like signaling protein
MDVHAEFSAKKVTVFVGETDRHHGHSTYHAIVSMLREEGVAGVSVTRGILGYGESGRTHSAHMLDLADDLPICVVFVDSAEVVERVLPRLREIVDTGLTTIEDVRAIRYSAT